MAESSPTCGTCLEDYNETNRLPRLIPGCGHTICEECLKSVLLRSSRSFICPWDKKIFDHENKGVAAFPVNYALKGMIKENEKRILCQEHSKVVEFFCVVDQTPICSHCAVLGEHKNHQLISYEELKKKIAENKETLEENYRLVKDYEKDVQRMINEKRDGFIGIIENKFNAVIQLLSNKRDELVADTKKFFEADRLEEFVKATEAGDIFNDIDDWKSKIEDNFRTLELCDKQLFSIDLSEEDLGIILSLIHGDEGQKRLRGLKRVLDAFEINFNDDFPKGVQEYCSFKEKPLQPKQVIKPADNKIHYEEEKQNYKNEIPIIKPRAYQPMEEVKFEEKVDGQGQESQLWDILREEANQFYKKNEKRDMIHTENFYITEDRGSSLLSIFCKGAKPLTAETKVLPSLISIGLNNLFNLKHLMLNFSYGACSKRTVGELSYILINASNLVSIDLNLLETYIPEAEFLNLSASLLKHAKKLTSFTFNLEQTTTYDKTLVCLCKELLPAMTNLESLSLDLSRTQVTDQTFIDIVENFLTKSPKLTTLSLDFSYTKVSNTGLDQLIKLPVGSIPNLTKLNLQFYQTQVTQNMIKEMNMLDKIMPKLRNVKLDLERVYVTA